ncbi:MAG: ABC transporter substrate-binding protein [Rhizobiaceae bacterium]
MQARAITGAIVGAALAALTSTYACAAPKRVVSTNICTDQLAMMIAAEGQLHSVSFLASDAASSMLAEQASRYVPNHGLAEEIFLMKPDLVIAGTFSTRATVSLLRHLGFRVEEFAPEATLDDVRANIRRMGDILGREERAAQLIAELDASLSAAQARHVPRRRVALYWANSFTSGSGTLIDDLMQAAGLANIAGELGIEGDAQLSLEALVLAAPDLIVAGERNHGGPALAQQNFEHPAFNAVATPERLVRLPDRLTICGGPSNIEAIRLLQDAALRTGDAP